MKKKNTLSLWSFPYRKRYYLTHPWKWWKDLYWNIRNFIHRGKYGYAYVDVWNFCDWYPRVGAEAIRYLARHNSGYPAVEPWKTMKDWREYLEYLANRLERCANSMDICFEEERNEYKEMFDEIMKKTRVIKRNENGDTVLSHIEFTPEEEDIRKRYWAREQEIRSADQAYNEETFNMISKILSHLWD